MARKGHVPEQPELLLRPTQQIRQGRGVVGKVVGRTNASAQQVVSGGGTEAQYGIMVVEQQQRHQQPDEFDLQLEGVAPPFAFGEVGSVEVKNIFGQGKQHG